MAEKMVPQAYRAMIEALQAFSEKCGEQGAASDLIDLCKSCINVLEDSDLASQVIYKEAELVAAQYAALAAQAKKIAAAMQEDLDRTHASDDLNWKKDEDDGDGF